MKKQPKNKTHDDLIDECLLDLALAVDKLEDELIGENVIRVKDHPDVYLKVAEKLLGKGKKLTK